MARGSRLHQRTRLNGIRIAGIELLRARDRVEVGGTTFEVIGGPADDRPDDDALRLPAGIGLDATSASLMFPPAQDVESAQDAEPAPAAAAGPPPAAVGGDTRKRRRGPATVDGQIRGIQQRTESMGESGSAAIWTFRLERYDRAGNRLPPVPVQMRGMGFEGSLHEGDDVRVVGRWRDGTLHNDQVQNLTTRAAFKTRSYTKALVTFAIVALTMMVGFFVLVRVADARFQQDSNRAWQEFCAEASQLTGNPPPGC